MKRLTQALLPALVLISVTLPSAEAQPSPDPNSPPMQAARPDPNSPRMKTVRAVESLLSASHDELAETFDRLVDDSLSQEAKAEIEAVVASLRDTLDSATILGLARLGPTTVEISFGYSGGRCVVVARGTDRDPVTLEHLEARWSAPEASRR